jgi:uncharacterized protein
MPRVVHFEINADNPQRAAGFYEKVFGWKIAKWDGPVDYWLVSTGEGEPGIDGGISPRWERHEMVNTVDVSSVDEAVKNVAAAGGKIVKEKQPVPGVGWLAYCEDSEGNVFGVMEADELAA